jgi:hypothetical protein
MLKKRAHVELTEKKSLLSASSVTLDHHMQDILEAVEEIHNLAGALNVLPLDDEKRDAYEGRLYVALTHLDHHVKPAIKEWDRVVDHLPED